MNSLECDDRRLDHRLVDGADLALGPVRRVGDDQLGIVFLDRQYGIGEEL